MKITPRFPDTYTGSEYRPAPKRSDNDNGKAPARNIVGLASDGPTVEWRLRANAAWQSSERYSGNVANDNKDWPLAKLLQTEGNASAMALANRYRRIWEAANAVVELAGHDASEGIYVMHRTDLDASTGKLVAKGEKRVGRNASAPSRTGLRTDPSQPRPMSKVISKAWQGDADLIAQIDARRALAGAQASLGWLKEAFEAAVLEGATLEDIGRDHGVGNATGAKGAGRALVFLGFQAVEECWMRRAA